MRTVPLRAELEPADALRQAEDIVEAPGKSAASTGARLGARHRLHAALALGDAAGVLLATLLVVSYGPWGTGGTSGAARLGFSAVTVAVILVVLAIRGSYASAARRVAPRVADDVGNLVTGLVAAGVCLLAMDALGAFRSWVPPAELGLVLAAAAIVVPVVREVVLLVAAHNPANISRLVIVGSGPIAQYLTVRLSHSRLVEVLGIVDGTLEDTVDGAGPGTGPRSGTLDDASAGRLLCTLEELPDLCERERVDRIVVAFSGRHPTRVAAVLQELRGTADIDVVVRYYELAGWESRLSDVTGLSLLSIGQSAGPVAVFAKRLLDVAVAAVALTLLSPLLALIALGVWVDSGTPIFFRQVRVGRGRRRFSILKFRTMRAAAPGGTAGPGRLPATDGPGRAGRAGGRVRLVPVRPEAGIRPLLAAGARARGQLASAGASPARRAAAPVARSARQIQPRTPLDTAPDASRITRVGGMLRRLGIDELPQLVNVLRGDMSLVGPRPFIPEECESLHGTVERRFEVRPGMTGLWQVCGQHEVGFEELCRLDVQYATSWSLRGDLRILARTPGRLLRGSSVVER